MIHSLPSRWHSATCWQMFCTLEYILVVAVNRVFRYTKDRANRRDYLVTLLPFCGSGVSINSEDVLYFDKFTPVKARNGNISLHSLFMPKFILLFKHTEFLCKRIETHC
jgi:hypothetical protein